MNIEKALEHFQWKFKNSWKPTEKDLEAYNAILRHKKNSDNITLTNNENYAKMYVYTLIQLSQGRLCSGERSIQIIDEILSKSVYEWCLALKDEIPMIRFSRIGIDKYPIKNPSNINELQERNAKIIAEYETELTEALKYEISEESIISFVKNQINRTINKF